MSHVKYSLWFNDFSGTYQCSSTIQWKFSRLYFTFRKLNWWVYSNPLSHMCQPINRSVRTSLILTDSSHTIRGSVGLEEIGQQALLDGGVPAQRLLVQDEQEAMELHQELVQHWKHRHTRESQRYITIKIPLCQMLLLVLKYLLVSK